MSPTGFLSIYVNVVLGIGAITSGEHQNTLEYIHPLQLSRAL